MKNLVYVILLTVPVIALLAVPWPPRRKGPAWKPWRWALLGLLAGLGASAFFIIPMIWK